MLNNKHIIFFTALFTAGILILFGNMQVSGNENDKDNTVITIYPEEYPGAIKNPVMGFTMNQDFKYKSPWTSLMHSYIAWDWIEENENDGTDKILEVCNKLWKDVERNNVKVIPRVYLYYPGEKKNKWDLRGYHWPADIKEDDFYSKKFIDRVQKLIVKLGKCWDNDPRVAFIEMGIIGKWGEHHSPSPDNKIQKILSASFRENFKNKKITVRHTWMEFKEFKFGEYWDSWAHFDQMQSHGNEIYKLKDLWKTEIIGGEVAYDWGNYLIQPGKSPTDSLALEDHRKFIINTIKKLHCTQLRWIANYDQYNTEAAKGAEMMQKEFGYRFIIKSVSYNGIIGNDDKLNISLKIINTGSAPFYYNWPVEVSIHDPLTKKIIWKDIFIDSDIRTWLPGDNWNDSKQKYIIEPQINALDGTFTVKIPDGQYVICAAVLDPYAMKPSLRFAVKNYWNGGRHPLGYIVKGNKKPAYHSAVLTFDDMYYDDSLNYLKD